jgi:multidrug efflux pump subunit AcrB
MLTDSALKNPAGVAAAVALVVLLGALSLSRLPIQLFPDLSRPQIGIQTVWRTASPKEIESEILEPIESVLQGVPGLMEMSAYANPGDGYVNLTFSVDTDMQQTLVDVIARMNRLPLLPRDANPPVIIPGGGGEGTPALTFFFVQLLPGGGGEISDYVPYVEDVIRPIIEAVPGVANVSISNGEAGPEELQILFDPYRAAEFGVQLPEIASRISSANDVSGGFVDVGRRQYTLRFTGRYVPTDLKEMILEWRDGRPVRLGDIAEIRETRADRNAVVTQNGNPAIALRIDRENGANALETLNRVKAAVELLKTERLPEMGLTMEQSFDAAVYIYRAINLVLGNLAIGTLLAVGVLWWFLRRFRATLVVAIAIPISLLSTFVVLELTGRTLNIISLAGLAFAVGMVLDAAIIVLENIIRLREQGKDDEQSALEGTRQVWGALIASTATTVAIFMPVFFLKDIEGQLFGDLALTIAIAVVMSLVVAVTVLPLVTRLWIHDRTLADPHAGLWDRMTGVIMAITSNSRRRTTTVVTLLSAPVVLAWVLLPDLDYLPPVKRDAVDTYFMVPTGANWDTIDREVVQVIDERMAPYMRGEREPALKNYYILTFPGGGAIGSRVKDQSKVGDLARLMRDEIIVDLPDLQAFPQQVNLFGDYGGGRAVYLHLQSRDSAAMTSAAETGLELIRAALPEASVRPQQSLQLAEPELQVRPNDRSLGELGWDRGVLGGIVRSLGDGQYVGEYFNGDKRLDIFLRARTSHEPEALASTPLYTPSGQVVPLSRLADIERTVGPTNLKRVDRRRTVTLEVLPPEDVSLEHVLEVLKMQVEPNLKAALPEDGNIIYGGSADNLKKAIGTMSKNFGMALVILFLLMATLFRSIRDAGLALLAMPLAMVGGVMALRLLNLMTFQPLDLLTMIGFVILLGLVVNNAILLVHQTRSAEREGMERHAAVETALRTRLRPIFMSTLTSVFGMLPLLLMPGEGSVIYRGLAAVIVGGMSVSTVFTLLLLPALLRTGSQRSRRNVYAGQLEAST